MVDYLKKSIIQISKLQLGKVPVEPDDENVEGLENLDDFLQNENDMVLCGFLEIKSSLRFSKTLPDFECEKAVVFSKRSPLRGDAEDFLKLLQINTVSGKPTLDLYEFLNNVFSPQMQKHYDKGIKRSISALQSNLRTQILTENAKYSLTEKSNNFSVLSFVSSVEDEKTYWKSLSASKADKLTRKSAETFENLLNSISGDLSIIQSLPVSEVEDLLERCHNTLDDLWRCNPEYPKDRIKNLMDIIGLDVCQHAIKQFIECNIWKDDYNVILEKCLQSVALGEKWLTSCKQLTGLFWPSFNSNPWRELVYQPSELVQFISSLQEVVNIRTVHKQLLRLSTPDEQSDLNGDKIFKPFKDLQLLTCDDVSQDLLKARKEFEYLLQPAEERVGLKLKKQLMTVNANTRQLIYEFTRYSELINRPVLKKCLLAERQFLLNSLNDYVSQIQSQSSLETSKIVTRQETSDTIKEILFIRQLEGKANEVVFVLEKLLNDLVGYESIKDFVQGVVADLKSQHSELFDGWSSDVIAEINSKKLSLKETDPVIQFSKDKLMKVNYPSRLIILITEVRQLRAMGYHLLPIIEETSDHAKKFMKFARLLEQIANFHNTIGNRMIPSQKPMMLSSALELSKLVQEQEVVSWGEEKHVEKYVNNLKKIVDKLSQNNNLLTSYHVEIIDKIHDLENVSLLKDFSRWSETIKNIKNIVANVENKGFKNLQSWKSEIDNELCAILETEYTKNLQSLHLSLEEICVDLVYRNSALDLSPNREILDQMYEQQLKKYLNIPKNFKGISDSSEQIYGKIIDRNETVLENVSKQKRKLFEQLDSVIKHWKSWLQFEPLDAKKLTSWEHWDLHFRASKTFGQEIAKLPSTEERIGCFLIGLSRLRSDLESQNRSYWDQLVYSLKDSIAEDVVKLQNYIDPSTAALTKQPVTLDEIGESGFNYTSITETYSEMEVTLREMLNKSQTLSSWSREQVDSVNRLKGAWERLGSLISNHQHIMARQMETIKTSLSIEQENLLKEIERFEAKWSQINTVHNSFDTNENTIEGVRKLFEEVQAKRMEWNSVLEKKDKLHSNYKKFNLENPNIVIINEVENSLNEEETTWKAFEEFNSEFEKFCTQYWIVFRKKYYELEDFIKTWEERFNKENTLSRFVPTILHELQKYKEIIPVLKYVKGEDFSDKHWSDVFSILKIHPKPIDQILLKDFLDVHDNIQLNAKELQNVCKKAAGEIVIRQALKDIDQWEAQTKFLLTNHADSRGKPVALIKEFKDILNAIGDHQILLQSLKHSSSLNAFVERANSWEIKLENLNGFLSSLAQIQKRWLYLEPIFGSGTLAQEKVRFDRLDRDFRKVMAFIEKDIRVTEICNYPNLKSTLQSILEQLSRCQHSLDAFLKEKRAIFSRFLFLSDDDLLEIIGQASKEQVIQSHLKKLFAGIYSVQLDESSANIVAMCSLQGEIVKLANAVRIQRPVEEWLGELVKEMQATLKELLVNCQKETQAPDPLKYPSQILCLSDNVSFTQKCEQAINNMTLPALLANYKAQLNELSSLELNSTTNSNAGTDDSNVLELKLKSLLLDTIHHIRVLDELLSKNVTKITEWTWQKQLRYYANSSGDVTIKMAKARINYSYEYLGNEPKLVRTPLTERCFLTLTQAMHLGLGGNPYGPAGTGKTESVKALGAILGRQVLVFNCDEGIDVNSMGRILTGLVKTGAWGCFDEFNRLDETTLSAISMNIHAIQEALRKNSKAVTMGDQEVPVDKHCGIFVTLNPAGAGYGGRNKLPDNLKQLFRPVVMTHPDHEEIARTSLYCDGYRYADVIAKKIVEVFDISSKLLSKQQHYDWGLRAIKTVLSGCQMALKKFNLSKKSKTLSTTEELSIVVSTLRMDIVSKLTFFDTVKFNEIISNVFKAVPVENMENEELKKALLECYRELNLCVNERQLNKCLEFYKQLKQRMGVALIGPPSSGKTTIINLVAKAVAKMQNKLKTYPVNPKSMSRRLLLGYMDHLNQWNDGVLTSYSLQVSGEAEDVWSWIICDGDIDPEWVESLNSVLDDNRLMTLPSGWRIHFGQNVNFVFETDDLKNASPATISRIGIVYLGAEDVNLSDFLNTKLGRLPADKMAYLEPFMNAFAKGIDWTVKDGECTMRRSAISVAKTALMQLQDVKNKQQFIIALINGVGQQLKPEFRQLFADKVFEWVDETAPNFALKLYYDKERQDIDTYHTDPQMIIDDIEHGMPLMKTGQILKYLDMLNPFLVDSTGEHFLLAGPHGCAKRLLVEYLINEQSDIVLVEINCSSNLTTNYLMHKLHQHCITVTTFKGTVLKPKKGKLVLYFRNIHLLSMDVWGSNMVIEFLNQVIDYNGFFNAKTEFISVENVMIIGTMFGTQATSERFSSKLHLINIDFPDKEDLSIMIVAYLSAIIRSANFPKPKIVKLAITMITIFNKMCDMSELLRQGFGPLNPHDLVRWCNNLQFYTTLEVQQFEVYILEGMCCEALKIFCDRLARVEQKQTLVDIINDAIKANWDLTNITEQAARNYYVPRVETLNKKIVFDKTSKENWEVEVQRGIVQFGKENQDLDTVINDEMLLLTAAIMRSAVIPQYHLVLIGKSGVGRKTAVKISSALLSKRVIHPGSGSSPLFQNDLKLAIQYAGLECENIFLVLEDYVFSSELNMTIINLLMSAGEVPDLYSDIEMDSLVKGLKEKMDSDNFEGDLSQFFANNIKKHLHVFICLDQDNVGLRDIIAKCPALSQNSGLVWIEKWSDTTIKDFPQKLANLVGEIDGGFSTSTFHQIYKSLPTVPPSRYISMVKLYFSVYKKKESSIKCKIGKLESGILKLTEAKDLVSELKHKAAEQQEKLAEKQSKANVALDMISKTIKGANAHKEEMEVLKRKTESENVQLVKRKDEIEEELAEVEPLIQEARAAVGNIKTESLSEIRSLRAPPEIIRDILEGVLKLMGTQDTSWNSMKTFLAKRGVKEEIRSFDASRIQTENRQAVEKLMGMKKDSFDQKSAKRASVAAAPLAAWVDANVKYSRVLDKIRPLEREQNKLKQNLHNAESQLVELNANLSDVDATVAKLKEQLSQYTKEAAEIEIGLNDVNQTLGSAETLVYKLEDEFQRWQDQLKDLSRELEVLPNDSLLAAAFITFLSEEEEIKRRNTLTTWCSLLDKDKFNFLSFFSSEREQLQWQSESLPNDKVSLENAVVIKKGFLSPLLVDPNSTAAHWLKTHYTKSKQNFEHLACNSPKLNTVLEACIRFGKILLVEELEDIPNYLFPILRSDFVIQGERKLVRMLGRLIDCHSDFKIIMCSRNERITLSAEIAPYVCVLNFNVTSSGFVEQLLSAAITQEKPDLESRKRQLLHDTEEWQDKLYSLQSQLLDCLATSDGNILHNKILLATLNDTKSNSTAVTLALTESTKVQNELRKEYEVFLDISSFASQLYFACKEFGKFDILYSLSAGAYSKLFLSCLQTTQSQADNPDIQKRHLLQSLYNYMARGMFKNDRLPFFLHLIYRIFPTTIPENEMRLFLANSSTQRASDGNDSDLPGWISPVSIPGILNIKNALPDFYAKLQFNEKNLWANFMETAQCEREFPKHCQASEFQKLLVVQSLRPDKLLTCIETCCLRISGLRTVDPPVLSLNYIYTESNPQEPILLITTSGMDPSVEITDLAKQLNNDFEEISMGEGSEVKALTSLQDCRQSGKWLILKNLHLITYWLPVLAQNLKSHDCSCNFRLWLISESTLKFNGVLAQNSLKIAYEEPQGIGNNMERIYSSLGEKYENKSSRTSARIFFVFACLHALLQERRKYIPQGWSKFYEFNHTDLQTVLNLTEDLWSVETARIQWQFVTGLLNEAVYGGRIENIDDTKVLDTYLTIYFKDEVLSHKWRPYGLNANLPNTGQNKEYLQAIKQFPNKDSPAMFGLPENIDKAREMQLSVTLIKQLKKFYQNHRANRSTNDINFKDLHPYFTLWKKVNHGHDFIRLTLPEERKIESTPARYVFEEYLNAITLIRNIHKCFANLNKISKGLLEADENEVLMAKCLLLSQTPTTWLQLWNGPKDASQYLSELLQKTTYLSTWNSENADQMLRQPVKLSLFFSPETFLACSKQEFARLSNAPLDELVLQTNWSPSRSDALILTGILIEAALFANGVLTACKSSSESINLAPNCYINWVEKDKMQSDNLAEFPLYFDASRESKIANIQVECNSNLRDQYVLSGLAFYLKY